MKRRWIGIALFGLAVFAAVPLWLGGRLARPVSREIGPPPADLPFADARFASASGSTIAGWYLPGDGCGTAVLLHGVRADRRAMLGRARLFAARGYGVLLFDFQAHGESPGERITFGFLESRDARAALDWIRARTPASKVAAVGTSLGGAAALLGDEPLDVDALVLEAVYPTIEEAVENRIRLRLGPLAAVFARALLVQLEPRLGVAPESLRPIAGVARVTAPVLVVAGSHDRHTTLDESRRLFAAAPEPKELWIVEGAAHVDFLRFAPDEYEAVVLGFLREHLGC